MDDFIEKWVTKLEKHLDDLLASQLKQEVADERVKIEKSINFITCDDAKWNDGSKIVERVLSVKPQYEDRLKERGELFILGKIKNLHAFAEKKCEDYDEKLARDLHAVFR